MIIFQFNQASIEHIDRCEDAVMIFDGTNGSPELRAPIFAVIDGMGGQQHEDNNGKLITGQDAAQLIRDVLVEDLEHLSADIDAGPEGAAQKHVCAAIDRAHQRIYHELNSEESLPLRNRVGAVLTIAVLCENSKRLLVLQVGDTRAYLFTAGELIQLCQDEDNIEYLVRQRVISMDDADKVSAVVNAYDGIHEPKVEGTVTVGGQEYEMYMAWRWFITGNPALSIPAANVVINTVGLNKTTPIPEQSRIEVGSGDMLMICSDGLYKNLSDQEIINGLKGTDDPAAALGKAALARSQDNTNKRMNPDDISVIVVKF